MQFTQEMIYNITALMPLLLILLGVGISVWIDDYISRKQRRILLVIVLLAFFLTSQSDLEELVVIYQADIIWRTLISVMGYCFRPVILLLFCYIIEPSKNYRIAWVLVGFNAAVYMTALFGSHLSVWFADDYRFVAGPFRDTCLYVSGLLLIWLLYMTIRKYSYIRKGEMVIPVFIVLQIVVSVLMDSKVGGAWQPVSFLSIAIVISSVLFYIWLHQQFVRNHEEDLKAQQRIQIMMTQIQPHFLFNTIATIQALCSIDPEKAAEVSGLFAGYLRQNLDSLGETGQIPFRKELEHTKLYAAIEMVRFSNIKVEYDIKDLDFMIPPLSLQPMVENAIRHGIRSRAEGIVTVATRRDGDIHELVIRDNGVGFDVQTLETAGKGHIGLRNVRERIEKMCGGTFEVDSRVGTGTTITIRIPDEQNFILDRKQ